MSKMASSWRVLRSQAAREVVQLRSFDEDNSMEDTVSEHVLSEEQFNAIKDKASRPVSRLVDILEKILKNADSEETLGSVLVKSEEEWTEDPISEMVNFEYSKSLMWSGAHFGAQLTLKRTKEWRGLKVIKRLPIQAILFFTCDGRPVGISRTFTFPECSALIEEQYNNLRDDHTKICKLFQPGPSVTFFAVHKGIREYVKERYLKLKELNQNIQIPKVVKFGGVYDSELKQVSPLQIYTSGALMEAGLPIITFLTYEYLDIETGGKYRVVYGETVIVKGEGWVPLTDELNTAIASSESEEQVPQTGSFGATEDLRDAPLESEQEIGEDQFSEGLWEISLGENNPEPMTPVVPRFSGAVQLWNIPFVRQDTQQQPVSDEESSWDEEGREEGLAVIQQQVRQILGKPAAIATPPEPLLDETWEVRRLHNSS